MTVLGFTVTFHSPFRVGAAYARDGVDAAIDEADPLPADHLKGVMRFAAVTLLGTGHRALAEVFGSVRASSPWSWSSATMTSGNAEDWNIGTRHRVRIDPRTHSAFKDRLVLGEQASPRGTARFEVTLRGRLTTADEAEHRLVLRCAAAGVHGLGAWRRRGLGWVGIAPQDGPVTSAEAERLLAMKGQRQ